MKQTTLALAAAAALLTNASAFAGEFAVGIAAYKMDSPYQGFDDEDGVVPLLSYEGEDFSFSDGDLGYRIYGEKERPLNVYLVLTSAGSGFDSSYSAVFAGMAERDDSIDFGLSADLDAGPGVLSATLVHDISGSHKGYSVDIGYSLALELSDRFTFEPAAGVQYLSSDFTDYYFGVRSNEVTASRAAYTADSSVHPYVGYQMQYELTENWMLLHDVGYAWLDKEVQNSPLVDKEVIWAASLGAIYRF
ncbi:MipA/OmpV family protein [Marinobacterium jannaschii]|uniref:MipA/OmpV family protein n=1 Tax=Marinobacterium jannaschii TaxID=64970 RepID=UPI00068519AE|nr:MipA/OmpV family protein [Marinobacterium jannaschii]